MTLEQFKGLTESEQSHLIDRMVELRRVRLDASECIMQYHFRYIAENAWPVYKRPTDSKVSRAYDYEYGMWKFLFQLDQKMTEICYHNYLPFPD